MQTSVLLTGGTGLIGTELSRLLIDRGYNVIILTRNPAKHKPSDHISYAAWDVEKQTIDNSAIARASYIIHLAGAGVAEKRWSEQRKKEIVDSRTQSSALLIKALQETPNNVKAVVSASAIGWYGPDNGRKKPFDESAPAAGDFLGHTCKLWEESISPVETLGKRLVILRTGIVLSKEGGALVEFKKPLKAGIATILGGGDQVISWIHIDDMCRIYLDGITNAALHGVYNAVAPTPVSNAKLIKTLAAARKGKFYITIPVPSFALKLALGEMSIEILKSTTVSADKIKRSGFQFLYPTLEAAMPSLV